MNSVPWISILLAIPLLTIILLAFVPDAQKSLIRKISIVSSAVSFLVSLEIFRQFRTDTFHFQFVEKASLVKIIGLDYHLGIDGISIWLVLLTTFLTLVSLIFSVYIETRVKAYYSLILLLQIAMIGVFTSLNMLMFFIFFEATLVPMYFLISIWGGSNRNYASIKFFLFTAAGSIFMLLGMIALFFIYAVTTKSTGTFDIIKIQELVSQGVFWSKDYMPVQAIIFWSFAVGFLVKVPMFPVHTWLPDAHTEAPTAGSIILAGVLLKMGTYGFLRLCLPMFPEALANAVLPITILCVIGIIYGGVVAAVQPDVKKLVAYSSVAHMGFVMIGIISLTHEGLMGGAFQQLNHGISTGAMFLLIGLVYERTHTRQFSDYGGLKKQMPIFSALFLITMFSSVGLPGLNGFVGEFLALYGSFMAASQGQYGLTIVLPAIASTGVIVAAVYLLVMFMKMFYGPVNPKLESLKDIKPWEIGLVSSLVLFMFWGGLSPNTFLKPMENTLVATRLMATMPEGERPSWANPQHEIKADGAFVEVVRNNRFEEGPVKRIIVAAPAKSLLTSGITNTTLKELALSK